MHALVHYKTVGINAYHTNTPDKTIFNNNYYSDKAPGTVALALTPFALAAAMLSMAGISLDSETGWFISSWVACAGSIGVITALGGVALFAWLAKHLPPRIALVTTLALFLGAAPLPYATMMFSHALVVGLLSVAICSIENQWSVAGCRPVVVAEQNCGISDSSSVVAGVAAERGLRSWLKRNRWSLLAGHACGWALASEYSSGLVVIGLFLWLLSMGWRGVLPFCVAAVPPLLLIPAYSSICFGTPFTLAYSYQASFPAMQEGLYAIKWPDGQTAFNLLCSRARGLLFWTPFFVMAFFGYWHLIQYRPILFWLSDAFPLLHLAVISGRVWDWPAGPAFGPRLLSPMLPLLALPCAYGVQRFPKLGITLGVYSILATTLATLTDACLPYYDRSDPLFDMNIPLFLYGYFSPNLRMALGLSAYVSVVLYYLIIAGSAFWLWRYLSRQDFR